MDEGDRKFLIESAIINVSDAIKTLAHCMYLDVAEYPNAFKGRLNEAAAELAGAIENITKAKE